MDSMTFLQVSIPVWYDWQSISRAMSAAVNWFQFQFGTIGRSAGIKTQTASVSFNSSLVRLAAWLSPVRWGGTCVSIPVWYDWQGDKSGGSIKATTFQFQFGTIGRVVFKMDKTSV